MIRRLVLICIFLSLPQLVQAQSNYCDTTPATTGNGTVGTPMTLQVCAGPNDTNGNPVTITGWTLYDAATGTSIALTKGSTSTVSGQTVYNGTYTPTVAGPHTLTITATGNAKESVKSASFLLTAVLPPAAPTVPVKLSVL